MDAQHDYQAKKQAEEEAKEKEELEESFKNPYKPLIDDKTRIRGDKSAPITIVEYSDFQCPYCREVESSLRQVLKKYGDQVRLVYMDFPLAFHQHAMEAAIAARCADEQGQFWPYHDALLESPSSLSTPALKTTAAELGLDSVTFGSCLDERKFEANVVADRTQGESIGAKGTPYFVVGSRSMSGAQPLSAFESVIDEQLRRR
jgi:protein-disulfide isomerase